MNNESPTSIPHKDYQDFKTLTPKKIEYLSKEQGELADEHSLIIRNLRGRELTAKEIHKLYLDDNTKKYGKTLKTIYRYLEKLEDAGIVTIAGHRITKGSRVAEKLYGRTAQVFILHSDETEMCDEKLKEQAEILTKLIGTLFNVEESSEILFKKNFTQFLTYLSQENKDVLKSIAKNNEIANYFAKSDLACGNYILNLTATFNTLFHHPELLEQLKNSIV